MNDYERYRRNRRRWALVWAAFTWTVLAGLIVVVGYLALVLLMVVCPS